jgi:hypothetical protein
MGLLLESGNRVFACGYAAGLQIFDSTGNHVQSITGPQDVNPSFYSGFQIMPSGNYVVTNWQGHGAGLGGQGKQVLEYDPSGSLVWSWQQDASQISSLQAIIVLNGLDTSKLHVEGVSGKLEPVN